jgi:hypothetical protein
MSHLKVSHVTQLRTVTADVRVVYFHITFPVFVEMFRVVCDVQVFVLECRMCFFIHKTLYD